MSLLGELKTAISALNIPCETAEFSNKAVNTYVVFTPLIDRYKLFADNLPGQDVEEVRVSLFTKGNYTAIKKQIETALINAEITITDRRYIGHEDDTGYHHYAIDVAKHYVI